MMLKKVLRIGRLYDIYGCLLTDKQANFIDLYYNHDLSLGEIAQNHKISRQSVHDTIKKSEALLENYEKKLGLYKKSKLKEKLCRSCLEKLETISKSEGISNGVRKHLEDVYKMLEELKDL